jgi:Mce-associated membrane protein
LAIDAGAAGQLTAAADAETDDVSADEPSAVDLEPIAHQGTSTLRWALALGAAALFAVTGLCGWLGYGSVAATRTQHQRDMFLEAGRRAALNLTTISADQADAQVARILDSATGTFHDDWAQRAPAFVDVVKKAGSKTEGSVTAAGLESVGSDRARVLVAVSVKTTTGSAPEENPRAWRMRIDVQKVNGEAKVANVEFVP